MYFTSVTRFSPEHGRTLPFYKLKESFRDVLGRIHTRVMLTSGYLPDLCCDGIVQIRRGLTYLMEQSAFIPERPTLFPTDPRTEYSKKVCAYIDKLWEAIKSSGKIDAARDSYDKAERKARRLIDVNTIKHTDAREVGAENVCLIREFESSNRQLKTDLELRPIYHQSDENSDAHLFFGLLAYWIVNTIRYKLKQHGITHYWTEIKRILSTQKAITTEADNALGERVEMRLSQLQRQKLFSINFRPDFGPPFLQLTEPQ